MFAPLIFIYSAIVGIVLIPMNWNVDLFVVNFVPWRLFIAVIAIVNATNSILFAFFLPETPKFLLAMNQPDEALNVLRIMYKTNTSYLKEVRYTLSFERYCHISYSFFRFQSYPVHHLIRETNANSLMATKGFSAILKLVWNQTKPIFIAPYLDSTAKLSFMVFALFAIGYRVY